MQKWDSKKLAQFLEKSGVVAPHHVNVCQELIEEFCGVPENNTIEKISKYTIGEVSESVEKIQIQSSLMMFNPACGSKEPYPSHAQQYREWHGSVAWIFNPWFGNRRDPRDIGSDPFGHLIMDTE